MAQVQNMWFLENYKECGLKRKLSIEEYKKIDGKPFFKLIEADYGCSYHKTEESAKSYARNEYGLKSKLPRFKWRKLEPQCTYRGCTNRFLSKPPCALCYE